MGKKNSKVEDTSRPEGDANKLKSKKDEIRIIMFDTGDSEKSTGDKDNGDNKNGEEVS